ncbi:MAG: hypothetical protein QXY49_06415, partial [Thermofilaceae archaeon]
KSQAIAFTALMSASALIISSLRVELPFYPLTFLKLDFAEIPSLLTFMLVAPKWSYFCALLHYFGLLSRGGDPLGPTMKFTAVLSMLFGMHWGLRSKSTKLWLALLLGMGLRSFIMALANYILLSFLFPSWLDYSKFLLNAAGIGVSEWTDVIVLTLVLVTTYNCIHTLFSFIPAKLIASQVERRLQTVRLTRES